jgi:deazaflavin-dependent oxidoreductase (nitroreductase family)
VTDNDIESRARDGSQGLAATHARQYLDGDDLVVAASFRGSPRHPDWYLNLLVDPRVWVRLGPQLYSARAEPIPAEERDRLWDEVVVTSAPQFADYQASTDRVIPLVRLVPTD